MQSPVGSEKVHSSQVKTPDFEAQFLEIESPNLPFKSSAFSRKGHELSRTSAPASLFNTPEQLPYTQGLEETVMQKYSAVKEVFNNLSGSETESAQSNPSSPLSPALVSAHSLRKISQSRFVPPLMPDTLLDESAPQVNSVIEGTT